MGNRTGIGAGLVVALWLVSAAFPAAAWRPDPQGARAPARLAAFVLKYRVLPTEPKAAGLDKASAEKGGHGFGYPGRKGTSTLQWPADFLSWMKARGLLHAKPR